MTELKSQLISIAQDETVTIQEKLVFLQETRHCFGRTALMMSAGHAGDASHRRGASVE